MPTLWVHFTFEYYLYWFDKNKNVTLCMVWYCLRVGFNENVFLFIEVSHPPLRVNKNRYFGIKNFGVTIRLTLLLPSCVNVSNNLAVSIINANVKTRYYFTLSLSQLSLSYQW